MQTIETRIGEEVIATPSNKPTNLSRTYVWVVTQPPVTERYQFMGDPRHCPYIDVKQNHGYNPYFVEDLDSGSGYSGFDKTIKPYTGYDPAWSSRVEGNSHSSVDVDLPRFYWLIRNTLMNTSAVFSSMDGVLACTFGLGGEFGFGGTTYGWLPLKFPVQPWFPDQTGTMFVNELTKHNDPGCINQSKVIARTDKSWYARYWLGELYPDYVYTSQWQPNHGNLPVGVNDFYRADYSSFTAFGYSRARCPAFDAAPVMLNTTTSNYVTGKHFRHKQFEKTIGTITNAGISVYNTFNIPLIAQTTDVYYPFSFDDEGATDPFGWENYAADRTHVQISMPCLADTKRFYYSEPQSCSALIIRGTAQDGTNASYFINVTEMSYNMKKQISGRFITAALLKTFIDSGVYYRLYDNITQVPRVIVSTTSIANDALLTNPSVIPITWNTDWRRWDGEYHDYYPANFVGYPVETPLRYHFKYSSDGGATWKFADGVATAPGERVASYELSNRSQEWDASSLSAGAYILMVECYRKDYALHYSYDQIHVRIKR
jgi:hypothetical protein